MKNRIISESTSRPASGDAIQRFESERAVSLPSEYRNFLMKHNGGRPLLDLFSLVEDPEEIHGVQVFLSLGCDNPLNSLERWSHLRAFDLEKYSADLDSYLVFAISDSGNPIFFNLETGKILMLYMDREDVKSFQELQSLFVLLANDFGAFFDGMTDEDENESDEQ